MILFCWISAIISLLWFLWLFASVKVDNCGTEPIGLRIWSIIVAIIFAVAPIFNLIFVLITGGLLILALIQNDVEDILTETKFTKAAIKFLNKKLL